MCTEKNKKLVNIQITIKTVTVNVNTVQPENEIKCLVSAAKN